MRVMMKTTLLLFIFAAGNLFAQPTRTAAQVGPTVAAASAHADGPVITAIDGYAARVDSKIITYGDVRESALPVLQKMMQRFRGDELKKHMQQAYLQAREALIEEALLAAEAKERNLNLPPQVINEEVDRLIKTRFNNDRTLHARALASRRMTFDEWKEDVAEQLTIRIFYNQEVLRRVSVSKQAVEAAYNESKEQFYIPPKVKFRAILINKGETEADRAVKKQQVESIRAKLLAGADFAETAEAVSEGIRASEGGAFPWSEPKEVREELRPALASLPVGQISEIIETDSEYYLLKMEERRAEGCVPFKDVSKKIEQQLLTLEQNRLHRELIERVTAKHYVERY